MSVLDKFTLSGGRLVNPQGKVSGVLDIYVEKDVITRIGSSLQNKGECFDVSGQLIFPGLIDMHVHLRVPGYEHKEDLITGTKAAAQGGFASVLCMANTNPIVDRLSVLRSLVDKIKEEALIEVYPIVAATKDMEGEKLVDFESLLTAGAIAFSDDGFPLEGDASLFCQVLKRTQDLGSFYIGHMESLALSKGGVINDGEVSRKLKLKGITNRAEYENVKWALDLCAAHNLSFHLTHISTKESVDLIRKAKAKGLEITADTCPHYFSLTEKKVLSCEANAKMNPPLRQEEDRKAVIAGLEDGTLDCITTDHAPHSPAEKAQGLQKAPFGIIGLETCLSLVNEYLVLPQYLTWEEVAQKLVINPCRLLQWNNRSKIAEGQKAYLTVFDPSLVWEVKRETIFSKSLNTPFLGESLIGKTTFLIVDGNLVIKEGKFNI